MKYHQFAYLDSSEGDHAGVPMKPATNLIEAYKALDPRPLKVDDPYFVDLTAARHSNAMLKVNQIIQNSLDTETFAAVAFSGHRGTGKSTELKKLQQLLEGRCFTLYIDVDRYLDPADIDYTDLFLLFSRRLIEELAQAKVSLPTKLLESVEGWFKTITKETEQSVELSAGITAEASAGVKLPFVAKLLAKLTADVKAGSSQKIKSRQELDQYFSGLLNNTNTLLSAASIALSEAKLPSKILILVDNLDRLPPDKSEALFFDHGSQLQQLLCQGVYTTSIDTYYSRRGIWSVFPNHEVLPNITIAGKRPERAENEEGIRALLELVKRRLDVTRLASEEVVKTAIQRSGGSIRQLVRLLREAVISTQAKKEAVITTSSLEDATTKIRQDFERILESSDYALLTEVAKSNAIVKNAQYMGLLSNTAILEYNGGDIWHDVNPVIEDIDAFKTAANPTT